MSLIEPASLYRMKFVMEIKICNYLSCSFLLENHSKAWSTIVILDSDFQETDFLETHSKSSLILKFDDVTTPKFGKRPACIEDLNLALDFSLEVDNLAICCRAGQSRSSALALVMKYSRIGSLAFSILNPFRHSPNSLVVRLGAEILDDASLLAAYDNWQEKYKGIRLVDFVDDIAGELDALEALGARNKITKKVK